jgi:hypothetical protein
MQYAESEEKIKYKYRILVGNAEDKKPSGKSKGRRKNSISKRECYKHCV